MDGRFPRTAHLHPPGARALAARREHYDVVHDNQSLGYGLLALSRLGLPLVATAHHPITVDRRVEIQAAPTLLRKVGLRRWYTFTRMQARVARRMPALITVSENSERHRPRLRCAA